MEQEKKPEKPAWVLTAYRVHMEDGTVHEVDVDQREWSQMEGQGYAGQPMTGSRYMVWYALRNRTREISMSWTRFNEAACLMIEDITAEKYATPASEDEDGEDEESLDPGR